MFLVEDRRPVLLHRPVDGCQEHVRDPIVPQRRFHAVCQFLDVLGETRIHRVHEGIDECRAVELIGTYLYDAVVGDHPRTDTLDGAPHVILDGIPVAVVVHHIVLPAVPSKDIRTGELDRHVFSSEFIHQALAFVVQFDRVPLDEHGPLAAHYVSVLVLRVSAGFHDILDVDACMVPVVLLVPGEEADDVVDEFLGHVQDPVHDLHDLVRTEIVDPIEDYPVDYREEGLRHDGTHIDLVVSVLQHHPLGDVEVSVAGEAVIVLAVAAEAQCLDDGQGIPECLLHIDLGDYVDGTRLSGYGLETVSVEDPVLCQR